MIVDIYKTKRRYATILADPPWKYDRNRSLPKDVGGEESMLGRRLPYGSMETNAILKLPIERVAADDAMLWLWVTNSHMHEGLHIMKAWGFEYKNLRTWFKDVHGTGYWFRGQTEHLLLGVRGHPTRDRHYKPALVNHGISTILSAPSGAHSSKPPESYRDIEKMSAEPRIELFARRPRKDWDSWGLEAKDINKKLERDMEEYL